VVSFECRGSGPALVLVHGLGADRRMWDPVAGLLERERTVVLVDMPGFGASPALADGGPATPARLGEQITRALAADGIERPHVAGNSLGGWVALEMGLAGTARSVTGIAPAGLWRSVLGPRPSPARIAARRAAPLLPLLVRIPRIRRLAMAGTTAHPDRVPPAAVAHLVRSYGTAPGFDAANHAMRSAVFEDLGRIPVPVTLAWPEHDRLVRRPQQVPPGIREVVLAGCGHMPTYDDPQAVARVLLEGSATTA
jgi:pimeloyl-ACP methyl ester carboxylesterase